jgi:hypothetical protein
VVDVRNETMLAVSTTFNGCQLLAGTIGRTNIFMIILVTALGEVVFAIL